MAYPSGTQLITYANSLGGSLSDLRNLLRGPLRPLFPGGVHILPPFPSSADRGFAPVSYSRIDPAFGSWSDVEDIGRENYLALDLMVNHISRQSEYYRDFMARGRDSPWADLFLTVDKVWAGGRIPPEDAALLVHRRPGPPYVELSAEGRRERLWSTFGPEDCAEQLDIDVRSPAARQLFKETLAAFAAHGVKMVRLDAVGYVTKKAGTSCFFVEPDIWEFLAWIREAANDAGVELLPELHSESSIQRKLVDFGFGTYDFILPGLVLFSFLAGSSTRLVEHLRRCPRRQVTVLDCHDGIPIRPDLDSVLSGEEARMVVDSCLRRGANVSYLSPSLRSRGGLDIHQVNCTYYDALGRDDEAYLTARAIQLFAPGTPQIYYVGLLAGENDYGAIPVQGTGRAVNRHDFSLSEVEAAFEKPVVRRLRKLIEFRNACPAFAGEFAVEAPTDFEMVMSWKGATCSCSLEVDFRGARTRLLGDMVSSVDIFP